MFESKIPVTLCRTEEAWTEISFDLYYWRRVPEAEYDEWVDRCEALDQQIESILDGAGYNIGEITFWRDRAVELEFLALNDERLNGLTRLLKGKGRDWRISIRVWSDLMDGECLGTILIGRKSFAITEGLAKYFPDAYPVG